VKNRLEKVPPTAVPSTAAVAPKGQMDEPRGTLIVTDPVVRVKITVPAVVTPLTRTAFPAVDPTVVARL
jgi:hypothetical protein